jgi:hypothetical protein
MGLFNRKSQEPPPGRPSAAGHMALARQMQAQAMQWQAQAMQQATAVQQASAGGAAVGSMTWARQVLAILAPAAG